MKVHQPVIGAAKASTNQPAAEEKVCISCQESLPADTEFFFRDKRQADGLRTICKACYNELPSVQRRNKRGKELAEMEEAGYIRCRR